MNNTPPESPYSLGRSIQITFTVPKGFSLIILGIAIILILWFYFDTSNRPVAVFFASVAVVVGTFFTVLNGIANRRDQINSSKELQKSLKEASIHLRDSQLAIVKVQEKRAEEEKNKLIIKESFGLIEKWNDPSFADTKAVLWEVFRQIEKMPKDEKVEFIRDNPKYLYAITDVLNFFEMMGLEKKKGYVDDEIIKSFFRLIINRCWGILEDYIQAKRNADTMPNPRFYQNFQYLYQDWI